MSSSSEVTSALGRAAPCAACKRMRRKCVPECVFAPHFPPGDGDRFSAVHSVFGASNVSKLLAQLEPGERAEAVESLVYQAAARRRDPTFGCVSYITVLRDKLEQVKGQLAAARVEFEELGGPAAALQPFDLPAAQRTGEAQLAATLRLAEEQDDAFRAKRQADEAVWKQGRQMAEKDAVVGSGHGGPRGHGQRQPSQQQTAAAPHAAMVQPAVMTQQAPAAQQHRHPLAQAQHGTGLAFTDGRVHGHQTVQQLADVQQSAAADQVAREQDMMMLRQVAEMQQTTAAAAEVARQPEYPRQAERYAAMGLEQQTALLPLQMAEAAKHDAATEVTEEQDLMMRVMQQAAAEEQYYNAAMAEAQQLTAAEEIAMEQDMMIQQAAAAAGLTTDQYVMLMVQQVVAGGQQDQGQAEQYAAMGLTMDQNMTMMQQVMPGGQQDQGQAEQYAATGLTRDQNMTMMQQVMPGGQQDQGQAEQYAATGLTRDQNMTMMQQVMPGGQHDQAQQYANMRLDVTLGLPDLQQQMAQQIANAQQLSAAAEVAREQELMMQQQQQQLSAAAEVAREQELMMMQQQQQLSAAAEVAREQELMMMQQQQKLSAAAEVAREQELMMMQQQQQLSAAAEVAREQELMMQQQQQQLSAAAEVAREQELMMMMQQQQLSAAAEVAREQELMMMQQQQQQQQQQATAYAHAMPGTGSGATIVPFLPVGSANADAFLAQEQRTPWLARLPFLPDGSLDAEAFLVQQPPAQTVNALGSQVESSSLPPLPPSLADLPRRQQNYGGDEGQSSSDLAAYFSIPYPHPPSDGR